VHDATGDCRFGRLKAFLLRLGWRGEPASAVDADAQSVPRPAVAAAVARKQAIEPSESGGSFVHGLQLVGHGDRGVLGRAGGLQPQVVAGERPAGDGVEGQE
jgi:hypothetical protein